MDGQQSVGKLSHKPRDGAFLYHIISTYQNEVTMSDNMSYSEVLSEMQDIKSEWRRNNFTYSEGQKERYEFLLQVRRLRVSSFYRDGRAHIGGMQSS